MSDGLSGRAGTPRTDARRLLKSVQGRTIFLQVQRPHSPRQPQTTSPVRPHRFCTRRSAAAPPAAAPACLPDPSMHAAPPAHGVPPPARSKADLPVSASAVPVRRPQRTHGPPIVRTSAPRPCVRRGCAWLRQAASPSGASSARARAESAVPLPFHSAPRSPAGWPLSCRFPLVRSRSAWHTLLSFHSYLIIAQPKQIENGYTHRSGRPASNRP